MTHLGTMYALVGTELALVTALGAIVVQHAVRRARLRAAAAVLEHMYRVPVPYLPAPAPAPVPEPEPASITLAEVAKYDAAAGARWVREATDVAIRIVAEKGDVTADDVWAECPPPATVDGRLMASVFDRKDWEIVDRRLSARGRNQARKIAVWKLKAREQAA